MGKHTLDIEFDYDFVLIGISSHEKDYRISWALNNKLGLSLSKQDSLEIKDKKQSTPSYFSFFSFSDENAFAEYAVIANFSESKSMALSANTLFESSEMVSGNESNNDLLVPEQKQMNYFFVVRAEIEDQEVEDLIRKIREIEIVLTAVRIDVRSLRSKQNLIF